MLLMLMMLLLSCPKVFHSNKSGFYLNWGWDAEEFTAFTGIHLVHELPVAICNSVAEILKDQVAGFDVNFVLHGGGLG